jgi:two-component system, OmpR family, phosphate regulon sensor histidine kinase PhoR
MTSRTISGLVILSVLAIIGIVTVQVGWLRRAYALTERQFRQSAFIALQEVADEVTRLNRVSQTRYAVTQLSADYFVVNTDAPIDPVTLEHLLQRSLRRHRLITDFEYGIYDCETDRMVYGNYVGTGLDSTGAGPHALPKMAGPAYYFGIRFPAQGEELATALSPGWIGSTVAVLLVVVLFGLTLAVVLRQRRLTEVQRDFINNITHELQTPVATIRIVADVLRQDAIRQQPDRWRQYTRVLDEESRRLQRQVETVLQLSRADRLHRGRHRFPLQIAVVDLHELLTNAATGFFPPITLDLTATRPWVRADAYHLTNVIANLLSNAVKFSPGTPHVRLLTRTVGHALECAVQDNGIGIVRAEQDRIFRQFYRVPARADTGPNPPGFGLGLYYVRQVVRAHRWQIRLVSAPGRGSSFSITIPVCYPQSEFCTSKTTST